MNRFYVATALNTPENHAILDNILKDLPQDDDWDMENPIQAIYKKQGLKRYKLEGLMGFTEKSVVSSAKETFASSANASSSTSVLDTVSFPSSGNLQEGGLNVKVENPTFQTLSQQLVVAKSAKTQLEKYYSQALDLKVIVHGKAAVCTVLNSKLGEYHNAVQTLDKFLQELREFLYEMEALDGSHEVSKQLAEANNIVDKAMAHQDGVKSPIKRTKAML